VARLTSKTNDTRMTATEHKRRLCMQKTRRTRSHTSKMQAWRLEQALISACICMLSAHTEDADHSTDTRGFSTAREHHFRTTGQTLLQHGSNSVAAWVKLCCSMGQTLLQHGTVAAWVKLCCSMGLLQHGSNSITAWDCCSMGQTLLQHGTVAAWVKLYYSMGQSLSQHAEATLAWHLPT
jgi:hypothetical protein